MTEKNFSDFGDASPKRLRTAGVGNHKNNDMIINANVPLNFQERSSTQLTVNFYTNIQLCQHVNLQKTKNRSKYLHRSKKTIIFQRMLLNNNQ